MRGYPARWISDVEIEKLIWNHVSHMYFEHTNRRICPGVGLLVYYKSRHTTRGFSRICSCWA